MSRNKAKKIVAEFAEILKKNCIQFKKIYLFGSHASGKPTKDSDIDVAVIVSKLPRGRGCLNQEMRLWELAPKADTRIEPILLEEKDLKKDEISIMGHEVREHGILVISQ